MAVVPTRRPVVQKAAAAGGGWAGVVAARAGAAEAVDALGSATAANNKPRIASSSFVVVTSPFTAAKR